MGYEYYDTPDGQDCGKKLAYLTKKAGVIGIFLSSSYVIGIETPPTYPLILARFARITGPCIAAAAAGAISVCTLVDLRKKDDELNHVCGGMMAGVAGGLVQGRLGYGILAGLLLGAISAGYKSSKIANVDIICPPIKQNIGLIQKVDLSLREKRPVEWIAK